MLRFLKDRLDKQSKVLLRNSSWIFGSNFIATGLGFVRNIVIARCLGVELFGTFSLVVAFITLATEYMNLNIGTALIRFGAIYRAENRNDKFTALVKQSIVINAVMAALTVLLVVILNKYLIDNLDQAEGLEWFIILFAAVSTFKYFNNVSTSMLRMFYKFKLNAIITVIMDVIETLIITLALVFFPRDLGIFFSAVIVTRFINGFVCNFMAFYEVRKEMSPYSEVHYGLIKEDRKEYRAFIASTSIGNSLKTTISQGDTVLLGWLGSAAQVGFYSIAKKIGYSILVLTDPLTHSIYPQLSNLLAEKRYPEVKKMLTKITSLSLIPASIFLFIMFFLKEWIIILLYGESFAPATMPFFIFLTTAVIAAVTFWTLPLIQSLGLAKLRLKIYLVTIATGIVFAYLLAPQYHAVGMAIASMITNLMNMVLFIIFSIREMNRQMIAIDSKRSPMTT